MTITWRNVRDGGIGDVAQLLRDARTSVSSGFDTFQDTIDERRNIQDQNVAATRENNTDSFMDALSQYQSPEELQSAIDDGSIEKLRSSFNGAIDRDATRDAATAQLSTLQNRVKAQNDFDISEALETARGPQQEIEAALADRNTELASDLIAKYQPLLSDAGIFGQLSQKRDERERTILDQGYADIDRDRALDYENAQIEVADIVNQIPNVATDFAHARQLYDQMTAGITDPRAIGPGYAALAEQYDARNSITQEQQRELDATALSTQIQLDSDLRDADNALERALENIPQPDARFTTLNQERVSVGDVMDSVTRAGWDPNTGIGGVTNNTKIRNIKSDFIESKTPNGGELSAEDLNVVDAIMKMAVEAQGTETDGRFLNRKKGLPITAIKDDMNSIWDAYQNDKQSRVERAAARDRHSAQQEQAEQQAATIRYNAYRGTLSENDLRRSLPGYSGPLRIQN